MHEGVKSPLHFKSRKMIACLENLVGIRTACGTQVTSDSGLYVQDLPHINLKLADAVVTDQESGYQLLLSKINLAGEYLKNDVLNRMAPHFKQVSVLENEQVGYFVENKPLSPGITDTYKGIQFKVRESPHLDLFISQIRLFSNYSGDIQVKVFDLIQGKELDSITVTAVAGEIVSKDVFKVYKTKGQNLNIFIGYDTTGIDSYKTTLYNPRNYPGCTSCMSPYRWGNKYVWLYSQKIGVSDVKVQNSLSGSNDTGGLSIDYSLNCTLDRWVCSMRNTLAFPLWHRAAVEILREVQISTRLNSLVTLKKEETADLMGFYEGQYMNSMDNIFKNLKVPNDICFYCNPRIQTGVIRPT